jgi:hypothetical protein
MEMIPLISTAKQGPLGVVHLPRMWFKMRAHAVGVLPEGYRHGNGGTDEALLTALGLDLGAFTGYIAREAPDYQTCETWVRANARDAAPATIEAFNSHVLGFEMPEPRRSDWTARFGLDGTYSRAVGLNQLDDWDEIHQHLLDEDAESEPLVPAISTSTVGPLGIPHLPRLWLKHRLHGVGRLMEGYRHGVGGFDQMMTDAIGVDHEAFAAYVESERPDYLTTEAWVRANATALTPETIAAWTTRVSNHTMPDAMLPERHAQLGITDPNFKLGIALNDLDDWASLHRQLLAAG